MLDKLIVSKNDGKENRRLGGFLLSTATGAFSVLLIVFVYSLFSYDIALANDDLTLSALIAPVQMAEQTPPAERATAAPKQQVIEKTIDNVPTRRDNMMRVDETPTKVPNIVSVSQNQTQARPNSAFKLGPNDLDPKSSGALTSERGSGTGLGNKDGISDSLTSSDNDSTKTVAVAPPPILKTVPKEVEAAKKLLISEGVINGKATTLVQPIYSPAAKAVRAQGKVEVQVTIDEEGRVISANAVSGHPLLTASAVSAARSSKFSSTYLSKQKVKVTGIIVYNFKLQ
ncbi:MAG: energy transducer TonB [Acidobacteriota bacterium]|nr:energy transducer TonB [Acidobacteriota bacterium]